MLHGVVEVDVVGLRLGDPVLTVFQLVHQLYVGVRPQVRVPALLQLVLLEQLFVFCVLLGSAACHWGRFALTLNCSLLRCGLLRLSGLLRLCRLLQLRRLLRLCGLLILCGRLGGHRRQVVGSRHVVNLDRRV